MWYLLNKSGGSHACNDLYSANIYCYCAAVSVAHKYNITREQYRHFHSNRAHNLIKRRGMRKNAPAVKTKIRDWRWAEI